MVQLYLQDQIAEIWFMGKLKLAEVVGEAKAAELMGMIYDQLLKTRNQNWMEKILPAVEEGNAVIAVGALHMGGEAGLLRLLEAQGFRVSPVSFDP